MVKGRFCLSTDDTSAVMAIRRAVFVDEQGYSADLERDAFDDMAVYALALDDGDKPVATGRLYVGDDDKFHIGRVCALKEARGRGLADLVMRMLLYRALELNAPEVLVSSQLPVVGFYARYGFRPYGETVFDEGVPHRLMRVAADEINIEGSCKRGAGRHEACDGHCERCENHED